MPLAYLGRNNIVTTPWNSERDAVLVRMWADGYSASQIAKQLEDAVSRCAVIGRAHRLKLPARAPRQKQHKAERKPRKWNPKWAKPKKPLPKVANGAPMRMLTLLQLKPTSCRFPIGDGPFLFCGAEADGSYCPFHKGISRVKESRR